MDLSPVYTVCMTFSLLWETLIVSTKLGNNIKKIKLNFNRFSNGSDGYVQSTLMTVWLTFYVLLSATWYHVADITLFCKAV